MVINELNQKARRLRDIVIFVGEMVMSPKCFKKMETLEATMKKNNINTDSSSSNSSSHGHAIFTSVFSFNATSTSSSNEWSVDS